MSDQQIRHGDHVLALWPPDRCWYNATVVAVSKGTCFNRPTDCLLNAGVQLIMKYITCQCVMLI